MADLAHFFNPRSVAVIGASDTEGRPTTLNFRLIRRWADNAGAAMYPVNPNKDTVDGLTCYPAIGDVPGDIDVAVILVSDAMSALRQVIDKGTRFCVMFSAGFAEVGEEGEARQAELEALVRASNTRLLGPNTNLNAFESFRQDLPGKRIALISQSGHQGRPIFQGQEIGIAMSHWAPTGNEGDLESADFIEYFADQPEIGAIAAYIEGFKDGRTLVAAADHAAQAGTPIVMVKVGRTEVGRSWAASHTGHLAGSDKVVDAVFRQYGITRVEGLDELLDTAQLFARSSRPRPERAGQHGICIYSISGGTSAHMADMATSDGLRVPALTAETQAQLREWIPDYLRVDNPVDNGGHPVGDERGPKILRALVADDNIDALVVPITGAFPPMSDKFAADLVDVAATTNKPVCVIWGSPVGDEDAYRKVLLGSQLPVFRTFRNCVTAIKAYFDYSTFLATYQPTPAVRRRTNRAAKALLTGTTGALSEHESKELLRAYGIPTTDDVLCTSAREATAAAETIGLPVVMKACGPTLLHKSDRGLVKVGVPSAKAVRATFADLMAAASEADGVLVSPLISGGVETVIGVARDETFGPTVMFGLGGISIEVFGDVTFRVPPFDRREAEQMVREIRSFPLLDGARGKPKGDVKALVDAILKVQRLALDLEDEMSELDINPLIVRPKGVLALDALAVVR
jgi:acyl-CoA synthetase (NDP forming)